jgi:hypothetical protein
MTHVNKTQKEWEQEQEYYSRLRAVREKLEQTPLTTIEGSFFTEIITFGNLIPILRILGARIDGFSTSRIASMEDIRTVERFLNIKHRAGE